MSTMGNIIMNNVMSNMIFTRLFTSGKIVNEG